MKIAILSLLGNVGKTTIAAHLFAPKYKDAKIISLESINSGLEAFGIESSEDTSRNFDKLIENLLFSDDVILDIGSSQIELFLEKMSNYSNFYENIDYFVVPVVEGEKELQDTIKLLKMLKLNDVPTDKIRIIFNNISKIDRVEVIFKDFIFNIKNQELANINLNCVINTNDIYNNVRLLKTSIDSLSLDDTDYRKLAKETLTNEKYHYVKMYTTKMLVPAALENLNSVFKELKL